MSVFFTIRFPSCGILHHMKNAWASPSISHSTGKSNNTHRMRENLGNWYSYFSHSMGAFFPLDSHPMLYFITWEMHGFLHQFSLALENAAIFIELGEHGKLVHILSPKYGYISPIRFPSYGILYHMGNASLLPSISNSTGKCSKIHLVSSQVVFPPFNFFCLFQNLVIHGKNKLKKPIK